MKRGFFLTAILVQVSLPAFAETNIDGLWHLTKLECQSGQAPELDGYDPTNLYMKLSGGNAQVGRLAEDQASISPVFEEDDYAATPTLIQFTHRFFKGVGLMKEAQLDQIVDYTINGDLLQMTVESSPVCADQGEVDTYQRQ